MFSFFSGLFLSKAPMQGLLEHYEQISKGMQLIEDSMECYISDGEGTACMEFPALLQELHTVEEHADTIKRYIRNHLPPRFLFPVDRQIFFTYTRAQDSILNAGLESLQWLAIRDVVVPEIFQRDLVFLLAGVAKTVQLLHPALEGTVAVINGEHKDRASIKPKCRAVRTQHKIVTTMKHEAVSRIYRASIDFKDIYQLIRFTERLHNMSDNASGCADILRVMIAD